MRWWEMWWWVKKMNSNGECHSEGLYHHLHSEIEIFSLPDTAMIWILNIFCIFHMFSWEKRFNWKLIECWWCGSPATFSLFFSKWHHDLIHQNLVTGHKWQVILNCLFCLAYNLQQLWIHWYWLIEFYIRGIKVRHWLEFFHFCSLLQNFDIC